MREKGWNLGFLGEKVFIGDEDRSIVEIGNRGKKIKKEIMGTKGMQLYETCRVFRFYFLFIILFGLPFLAFAAPRVRFNFL
ncbi:hypothetical protein BDV38DRAFT_252714 [Aspergillus pseudotamarii]|uniref:Uncharacterized protein n=1 Tax=Aspergillus pseudotamarii TaxID=132259 RepID=A0A5N6SL44_ASPPS|nr:uncharacterized protein BDV38DRAFT_252714 [Aspergillus pseudotamarii]KAE8135402.1 hypothetical protein BDV38DRAFT_252714 [Aspergillus pseudotamarii]